MSSTIAASRATTQPANLQSRCCNPEEALTTLVAAQMVCCQLEQPVAAVPIPVSVATVELQLQQLALDAVLQLQQVAVVVVLQLQ